MKKSTFFAILIIVLAVVGVSVFFLNKDKLATDNSSASQQASNTNNPNQNENLDKREQSGIKTFSKDEIAKHNTESDCWTIVSGNVYDITSYISRHSGGDEILRACGVDATNLFTQRQTPSGDDVGTGTPHSSSAENDLKSLQIGIVSN